MLRKKAKTMIAIVSSLILCVITATCLALTSMILNRSRTEFNSIFRLLIWLVVCLTLVEFFLRYKRSEYVESTEDTSDRFSRLNVASMESYGSDFLREEKIYKNSLLEEAEMYGRIVSLDNNLNLITIKNGYRLTSYCPQAYLNQLLLLGGSTIFNAQVPNSKTIPSLLQWQLNSNKVKLLVKNLGISGASSINRLEFIKKNEKLKNGDIVVLYFGVNDAFLQTQFRYKENSIDLIFVVVNDVIHLLRSRLEIFRNLQLFTKPRKLAKVEKYIIQDVIPNILEFYNWCENRGIRFLAILQPTLFTLSSPDENVNRYLGEFGRSFSDIFEVSNELFVRSFSAYDFFVDGRSVFHKSTKSVYCDWIHTTEDGNLEISKLIFGELLTRDYFPKVFQ